MDNDGVEAVPACPLLSLRVPTASDEKPLPCRHDKLLAQQDVLGHQLPMRAQQVGEAANDRARSWAKRFRA